MESVIIYEVSGPNGSLRGSVPFFTYNIDKTHNIISKYVVKDFPVGCTATDVVSVTFTFNSLNFQSTLKRCSKGLGKTATYFKAKRIIEMALKDDIQKI
jgi:hypothetical protein